MSPISDFSAVHNEVFKSKSKIQQEFLNTDAIYLTAHAALSLALRGPEKITAVRVPLGHWEYCSLDKVQGVGSVQWMYRLRERQLAAEGLRPLGGRLPQTGDRRCPQGRHLW